MIFRQLFDQESSTFSYLLGDTSVDSRISECIIFDGVDLHVPEYLELVESLNMSLKYAFDTHLHADHITAMGALRNQTQCKTGMFKETQAKCVDLKFTDNQMFRVGNLNIRVIHTPGHTQDSCCFYVEEHNLLFTGDTLLIGSTGRTDFQGGNAHLQYDSLFNKILLLPDETRIYPGHDYNGNVVSTIEKERENNKRLFAEDSTQYSEIMSRLNLPAPKKMKTSIPMNMQCGESSNVKS